MIGPIGLSAHSIKAKENKINQYSNTHKDIQIYPPVKKSTNMNSISISNIYLKLHQDLSVNFEKHTWYSGITVKIMPP